MYQPPYAWLMRLSIFESIRVPARFAMPAMLALAMTGALAFDRLRLGPRPRRALAAALMIGIVADGWIRELPLPAVPDVWSASRADGFAAVLELPLGDTFGDLAAMYRAIAHRHPLVNGNSGFEPTHYATLRTAIDERDPAAFDGLPATEPRARGRRRQAQRPRGGAGSISRGHAESDAPGSRPALGLLRARAAAGRSAVQRRSAANRVDRGRAGSASISQGSRITARARGG